MQPKTTNFFKLHRSRIWLSCFVFFLGVSLLAYFSYFWVAWGRSSLLLQYLFQCNCPEASEEARYSRQVDVIVSACSHVHSRLLPSGDLLYAQEEKSGITSIYLLNIQSGEKIDVPDKTFSSFLTDDLWFVKKGIEDYIVDRTTGTQYPIKIFRFWQDNSYVSGEPNLELIITALNQAEQVFFFPDDNIAIVLSETFQTNLEQNFTFGLSDIPEWDPNRVERFLAEHNISYQIVRPYFPHEVVSPNGKLIARDEGIYSVETNQMIAKAPPSFVRGWTSNGGGVVYSSSPRCLIRRFELFADDIGCAVGVPQPVLLLKVPDEYLSSK
jgi:hypothetical protein